MSSAAPWGAIPQAEGAAHVAATAVEKFENKLPESMEEKPTVHKTKQAESYSNETDTSSELGKVTTAQEAAEVTQLARQITQHSIRTAEGNGYPNPFHGSDDPALDPTSGHFKPEAWIRTLIGIKSRDPERYPQRTAGVSYKNLNVHGFGSLADYQKYLFLRPQAL